MGHLLAQLPWELLSASAAGIAAVFKGIAFVQEGQLGLRLRFGKIVRDSNGDPKIIHPGFIFMIPFVDTLVRRHVRQQTIRCDNQVIMLADDSVFLVSTVLLFRVVDIYKALFELDSLDASLQDMSMSVLRDVLSRKSHDNLKDISAVSEDLLKHIKERANQWGVEFISFGLTNCSPSHETTPLIQMGMAVKRRIEALRDGAEDLGVKITDLSPGLCAALIGIPVSSSLGTRTTSRAHIHKVSSDTEEFQEDTDD